MDYSTLAGLARPDMNQAQNFGSGFGSGMRFNAQNAQFQNFLAMASQEAEIQARRKAQEAEEFSAAAPGRMAKIDLANKQATDDNSIYEDSGRETKVLEAFNKLDKAKQEKIKLAYEKYSDVVNAIDGAKSDEEVTEAIAAVKAKNGDVGPFEGMNPKEAKMRAKALFVSQSHTPASQIKQDIEGAKGSNRLAVAALQQAGADGRTDRIIAAKKAVAQLTADKPNKFSILKEAYGDDYEGMLQFLLTEKATNAITTGAANANTVKALTGGDVNVPVPQAPSPPTPTPKAKAGGNPKAIPKAEALKIWEGLKNTPQAEQARQFFKETYGEEPPK